MSIRNDELYAVDISPCGTMILYGGKTDTLYLASFPKLTLIDEITNLSDSVISTKFIDQNLVFVATLDGNISLFLIENNRLLEVDNRNLEEDISCVEYMNDKIYIGTEKGTIHEFSPDLNDEAMFMGHKSDIRCMRVYKDKLHVLSGTRYIIYQLETQEVLFKRDFSDFRAFDILDESLVFMGKEGESILIKNRHDVIQKYSFGAECTLLTENYLIVGGSGFSLNVFNVKSPSVYYSLRFVSEKIEGISKIIRVDDYHVCISTFCGKLGFGDVRSGESFRFYEGNVGVIYDFRMFKNYIASVGDSGIKIIEI